VLRQRLTELEAWPEAGDLFLELLPVSLWYARPLADEDFEWLPRVVSDAKRRIDIGSRYPAFFQKLLTNRTLGQAFLEALDHS